MSKKIPTLLIVAMWCLSVSAQLNGKYLMKTYRVGETEEYSNQVLEKDSASFYRIISAPDSNAGNGLFTVNDYYLNGKPKMIGHSLVNVPNIRLQGASIAYFANGHKKSITTFENDKVKGDFTLYFENGKLYLSGSYDANGSRKIFECRDSTGKILVENGNGHAVQYNDDFSYVFAEGDVRNNLEEGEWHGNLKDSSRYVCIYHNGILKKGTTYDKKGNTYSFNTTEMIDPAFHGSLKLFYLFLQKNIRYPKVAKENYVQGKVFIAFVVNKDGKLSDFKLIRAVGSGIDDEALRVLKLSSPWKPGSQFGIPLSIQYTIPISFSLARDNDF